jgi:hypothetical protein
MSPVVTTCGVKLQAGPRKGQLCGQPAAWCGVAKQSFEVTIALCDDHRKRLARGERTVRVLTPLEAMNVADQKLS